MRRLMKKHNALCKALLLMSVVILSGCDEEAWEEEDPDVGSGVAAVLPSITHFRIHHLGEGEKINEFDDGEYKPTNFEIDQVELTWSEDSAGTIKQGDFYLISLGLENEKESKDVSVEVSLLDKNDLEQSKGPTQEIRHWTLDGAYIESLPAGGGDLEIDVLIPADVPVGEYVLAASVVSDTPPSDVSGEDYVDDLFALDTYASLPITVESNPRAARVDIVDVNLDDVLVAMPWPGEFADDGYTLDAIKEVNLELISSVSEPEKVLVSAVLELPDGGQIPLGLRDTENDKIVSELSLEVAPVVEHGDVTSIALYVSDQDYDEWVLGLSDPVFDDKPVDNGKILFTVKPAQSGNSILANVGPASSVDIKLARMMDIDAIELSDFDEPVASTLVLGNETQLRFLSQASLENARKNAVAAAKKKFKEEGKIFDFSYDDWKPVYGKKSRVALAPKPEFYVRGFFDLPRLEVGTEVATDLYVFGGKNSIAEFELKGIAALKKMSQKSKKSSVRRRVGWAASLSIFGSKIYDKDTMSESTVSEKVAKESSEEDKKALSKDSEENKPKDPFSREWKTEKIIKEQYWLVGVVPVKVTAGVKGLAKYKLDIGIVGLGVGAELTAKTEFDVFATGGVSIALASAEMIAELNVLHGGYTRALNAGLSFVVDDGKGAFKFGVFDEAKASLGLIRGKFGLRAEWISTKPWKWFSKNRFESKYFWFYQTKWLYQKEWDLIDKENTLFEIPVF